ncbi:serine hydrolase [Aequorivita antarctica]|uniref:Serine hydrolase n=1 Tax=Aequorivita antarctica TaxID=153266 RepID=A0A5C6YUZ5_9FLAO|nr:serine hydrolase [Aequorivita antarctica]TXD71374.1 serine hydrolase [Aequorivita antarctica]
MIFRTLAVLASFLLCINLTSAQSIQSQIDTIFNKSYPANSPGAIVLIAKDDKVIYRKSFGMANLELNVPMKPENVLRLASITKQFTSVSILLLMEQGKLNIQDPLSKYIADYPRGNEITLHNLLVHTSGIKSFTNLVDFRSKARNDMTPEEIISSFKKLPLEFEPGERYEYSNSDYVLLGYIIEKISGMSYENFVQKYIFDKLGMKNSYYGNSDKIIPNRANGYQLNDSIYQNAEYISMTLPYAAGSLMSTVDDMLLWSKAIHHNALISERSKQLAFTNYTLKNGKHSNYGYGWEINELAGTTSIEHTGGINGFTASGVYVPDRNIYSIVLTNLDDGIGPETDNLKAVSIILGKPIVDKASVILSEKQLKQWIGAYQFEDAIRFITCEEGFLYSTREGGHPFKLIPVSENEFKFDNSFIIYKFTSKNGKKQAQFNDRIKKSIGTEIDKKPASEKEAITLAKEILIKYVGVYELQPSFHIEIERQNDRMYAKATGQPSVELFAEAENSFFIKEIDAQVVFNLGTDGTVKSLSFVQKGQQMEGKKIR